MPDIILNLLTMGLNLLTVGLLAIGAFLLSMYKTTTEAAAKKGAEEGVAVASRALEWPAVLARELQKSRGLERQELRFQSYGALWKELKPLAIYEATVIDQKSVGELLSTLSNWYFSHPGGLLLTPQARTFYFALQDLLRATSRLPEEWRAERSNARQGGPESIFRALLEKRRGEEAIQGLIDVLDYFRRDEFEESGAPKDWLTQAIEMGKKWRAGVNAVATSWNMLNEEQRFATLQQFGSILRTTLTADLESRLR